MPEKTNAQNCCDWAAGRVRGNFQEMDNTETSNVFSYPSPGRLLPWVPLIIYVALISIMSVALYGMSLL
jgi:hypothetical protein